MKRTGFLLFIILPLFSFQLDIKEPTTNRSLLLMSPEEFFEQKVANQPINLYQPNNNLLSVSIFQATNLIRKKYNLPLFKPDYSLHLAGLDHIESMMNNDFFGHEDPYIANQRTFRQRIEKNGGNFFIVAENIALVHPYNTDGNEYRYRYVNNQFFYYDMNGNPLEVFTYAELGKSLLKDWFKSKGHRENLLAKELTHLGIAVVVENNVFQQEELPDVYAVQDFGAFKLN